MDWVWRALLVTANTVGLIMGLAVVQAPLALAPPTEVTLPDLPRLAQAQSLEDLYQLQDRLQRQLSDVLQQQPSPEVTAATEQALALQQAIQALDIKIHVETSAQAEFDRATAIALKAVDAGRHISPSVTDLQAIESTWSEAIAILKEIPQDTLIADTARQKVAEYTQQRQVIAQRIDLAQSLFLQKIAADIGDPNQVAITVCQVSSHDCRHWNGDQPPASAASLIKVPIAIALMQKVSDENLSLDTKILITRGNYTEDPQGVNIWPDEEYTLRELLLRMIDHSSNIATNQLIDYLGRDYINQVLRDRGYKTTFVDYKMVGEETYPANAGSQPNLITTNELTDMMVGIYSQELPGHEVILDGLVRQYDWDLGYKALTGSEARWVGEKTGQNSRALGTTVAVNIGGIDGDRYVISIILSHSSNQEAIRQGIRAVVDHILEQGSL